VILFAKKLVSNIYHVHNIQLLFKLGQPMFHASVSYSSHADHVFSK